MAGNYNQALGVFGFQEYQGSLREENLDGDPRFFRTFVGPSDYRDVFLTYVFGFTAVPRDNSGNYCTQFCWEPRWYNAMPYRTVDPPGYTTYPSECYAVWRAGHPTAKDPTTILMRPYGYRVQPHDDQWANPLGTIVDNPITFLPAHQPQVGCLCVIEIEYRPGLRFWPDGVHDPKNVQVGGASPPDDLDVPAISQGTFCWYEEQFGLEVRTLEPSTFSYCSFGDSTHRPENAMGNNNVQVTLSDVAPFAAINTVLFTASWLNTPFVPRDKIQLLLGSVNGDVWFGHPTAGVCFTGVEIEQKAGPYNMAIYDIHYKFHARTAPASGESNGQVMTSSKTGYVYNNRVGIWNRARWTVPIPGTDQYWWPVVASGTYTPGTSLTSGSQNKQPYAEKKFHDLFKLPAACT